MATFPEILPKLITDLKERGLLEDTMVVLGGEFGRTSFSQHEKFWTLI